MNRKIIQKILKVANSNLHLPDSRFKHFTFIVERNKIISYGWNQSFKTHPLAAKYKARFYSIHSELDAIKNFPYPVNQLKLYDLINVRILKDGTLGPAKPCVSCHQLLLYFGVRQVYYSTSGEFGSLII